MDEHESLRGRIRSCTKYKELLALRELVWNLSGKVEFSVYVELRKKVDGRLEEFNHPSCEDMDIKIIMPEGVKQPLDPRDCRIAISKDRSLSKYLLSKNPKALDVEIKPLDLSNSEGRRNSTAVGSISANSSSPISSTRLGVLQNKIENVIRLATYMNNTYSKVIPKISSDLGEIVAKLEILYNRVSSNEY